MCSTSSVSEPTIGSGGSARFAARLVRPEAVRATTGSYILGLVEHGPGSGIQWEEQVVARTPMAPLADPWIELFESPRPSVRSQAHGIDFAADGEVLFGSVEIAEGALESVSYDAFTRVLRLLEDQDYRHLLRVWISVPRINELDQGIERYRTFCRGRSLALEEAYGADFAERLCAASAVGSLGGELSICFLGSKERGVHCENPRQLPAYRYPKLYGPRSPSFARATLAPDTLGEVTFVAGTASIVGHESLHPEDIRSQLQVTLENLESLLASLPSKIDREPSCSAVKVFLRQPEHLAIVQEALEATQWSENPILYLRADVCRGSLLVEIEAVLCG